jgi:hypothetical protein
METDRPKEARRRPLESFSRDGPGHLFGMSCRFCASALEDYERGDKEFFLVHAGVAVTLAKAYLASLTPTLVAEGDFDSLPHASPRGSPGVRQNWPSGVPSVVERFPLDPARME